MAAERQELAPVRLPYPAEAARYGYSEDVWRVLTEAIFPNAQSVHSVTLALAYCKARNLDILKRPIHIVPIWDSKRGAMVETIWPGIGELRITASRTGSYAGKDPTEFGPDITQTFRDAKGEETVTFPSWARLTVYKIVEGLRCAFVGPKVYWLESYATRKHDSDVPNQMWKERPSGQLEKCAEAASLRAAYPEEVGSQISAEEIKPFQATDVTPDGVEVGKAPPRRKSDTLKDATPSPEKDVSPPPGPAQEAPKAAPNGNVWRGSVRSAEVKKRGTTKDKETGKDKPYTIYTITGIDGQVFETFSDTHYEIAQSSASGAGEIEISFATDAYGKKIKKMDPVTAQDREPGSEG